MSDEKSRKRKRGDSDDESDASVSDASVSSLNSEEEAAGYFVVDDGAQVDRWKKWSC